MTTKFRIEKKAVFIGPFGGLKQVFKHQVIKVSSRQEILNVFNRTGILPESHEIIIEEFNVRKNAEIFLNALNKLEEEKVRIKIMNELNDDQN